MIPLARGVAILNLHTRLTYLETNATSLLDIAAFGAAGVDLVHLTGYVNPLLPTACLVCEST
jgi:hypothetical protein